MLSCPRISSLMSATREGHRGNVHKRIVAALLSHRGFYWFSKKGHSGGFFWQDPTLGLRPLWIFHKASPATAHVSAGRHTALYCTLPPNVGASIQWSSKLYRKLYRRSSLHKPIEEMASLCDGSDCFDCWRVRRNQTPFQTQLCEKLGGQSWWDVQVSKHQLYTFFIQTQVCEIQIQLFCKVINLLERVFPHYISHCPRLGPLFTILDWVCVSDCFTSYYRYYRYCEFLARWWSTMMLLCAFCELGVNTLCIHMTLTHTKYTHSQRYFIVFYILRFLQY